MLSESLYPLGTVVLLKEGLQKLLIVGRGAIFPNPSTGEEQFSDYVSVLYPVGLDPNQTIFLITQILIKLFSKDTKMMKKSVFWKFTEIGKKL